MVCCLNRPALDLVLSRSCDIPHSEWKGLSRILQDLLFDVILTPRGRAGYESAFRTFIYPSSWPCIQNPESHGLLLKMRKGVGIPLRSK